MKVGTWLVIDYVAEYYADPWYVAWQTVMTHITLTAISIWSYLDLFENENGLYK